MRLLYAILADSAQIGPDGKIAMIGGDFDTVMALNFPAQHAALSLVVKLAVERGEVDHEHQWRMTLLGPGAQSTPLMEAGGPFTPRLPDDLAPDQTIKQAFVMNMGGLALASPGTYRFRIAVDGRSLGEARLYVKQLRVPGRDRLN